MRSFIQNSRHPEFIDHQRRIHTGPADWERMLHSTARSTPTAVSRTVMELTRRTVWTLVGELPLRDDVHHPQGMARIGSTWWVSTVDVDGRSGWVLAVDSDGDIVERVPVGDERHFHPGGMDFDGSALWIAAAEYRPDSSASIYRMQPGRAPERIFEVDDHVGAVARCGPSGDLVGWSWGSRRMFRWTTDGGLVASAVNPAFFVDHQDCQWLGSGHLLCGGVAEVNLADGPGWLGGLGVLDVDTLTMVREVPFPLYPTPSRRVATHNPLWCEVVGEQLVLHVLPDDGQSAILSYATPLAAT
jgi:hypothetical protein